MPDPEILSPEAAATYLHVSLVTVRRRLRDGSLPARRLGRLWRIPRPALDAFLRGEPAARPQADADEAEGDDGLDGLLAGARHFVAMMDEGRTRAVWRQADLDWLFATLRGLDAEIRPALATWDAAIGGD